MLFRYHVQIGRPVVARLQMLLLFDLHLLLQLLEEAQGFALVPGATLVD